MFLYGVSLQLTCITPQTCSPRQILNFPSFGPGDLRDGFLQVSNPICLFLYVLLLDMPSRGAWREKGCVHLPTTLFRKCQSLAILPGQEVCYLVISLSHTNW